MLSIYILLIIVAVMLSAFFSSSEMAYTSVNKIKLKDMVESGDKKAGKLDHFLSIEGAYIGTTLVGNNIAVVVISVLATRIFTEKFSAAVAPVLSTVVMVPVSLIFAEIVPKIIARQISLSYALNTVSILENFHRLFYPLIISVDSICRLLLFPFKSIEGSGEMKITKRDLKNMIYLGHETGGVEADEAEFIHKVLDLETKKVERIMVPLYRVSSIGADDTIENLKRLVSLTGFSRIPVYLGGKKNIVGIVNIYDVLFSLEENIENDNVDSFIREAVYIKREDHLDIALSRLRHQKQPMGIVIDKDEQVVGIITIEDILEEIVGQI